MLHHAAAAELDGKQVLDFYWTDPIDAIKRFDTKTNCTLLSSRVHHYFTRMIVPLTRPILEWYFKGHIWWIQEVLLY